MRKPQNHKIWIILEHSRIKSNVNVFTKSVIALFWVDPFRMIPDRIPYILDENFDLINLIFIIEEVRKINRSQAYLGLSTKLAMKKMKAKNSTLKNELPDTTTYSSPRKFLSILLMVLLVLSISDFMICVWLLVLLLLANYLFDGSKPN